MATVVADLVARIRADTTDVQQGAQAAKAELQGVQAQAEQTAAALRIMAQEFVKSGEGGTVEGWLENFKRGGVQPTAAALAQAAKDAEALGTSGLRAASGFQQTAAAAREAVQHVATLEGISRKLSELGINASAPDVAGILAAQQRAQQQAAVAKGLQDVGISANVAAQQAKALTNQAEAVVAPTQAAARAAEEVSKGWSASESTAVRFGAGVLGIGLGISLVASAARLVHEAISGVVGAQLDWEQSLVRSRAVLGSIAPAVVAMSQAQSQAPGLLGSQTEFLTANLNAAYLSSRFGVPQSSVFGLTSAAGRVSDAYGYDAAARADLQARALGFAEAGGSGLRNISGTEGDPLSIARRLGGVSPAQLQALTPQQLREAQIQIANVDLNQAALRNGAEGQPGLLAARTAAEQALLRAQGNLQNNLEGSRPGIIQSPTSSERALTQQILQYGQANPAEPPQPTPIDPALTRAVQDAQAAFEAAARAVGDATKAEAEGTEALRKLGVEANSATFRLVGFTGNLEDRASIARLDISAQAQGAVAARAVGPNPIQYQTPAEIAAQAADRASQDALKAFIAPTAQASLQQNQAIRQQFTEQANTEGPGLESQRAAAQAALDDLNRRQAAETSRLQAQQASAFAQRAQIEAQAQLSAIAIQQDERRLSVAVQLAGYRTQALQLEGQLAPILLQQANLQDRITVASRDNLASRRELIAAQQQQLAATQVTSQYDYQQQRLELLAEQSRAVVRQGGAPTQDINALRQQYRGLELERAAGGSDIAALDANRAVQVVGQQRTAEQLARDTVLTNLEAQARALQDQQIPIEQNLRATLLEEQSIQRQLALMDLQDTKAITAAQHALNAANQLASKAAEQERAAADLAANVDLGATAADRFASAMSRGYAAINDSAVAIASVRDMLNTMPSLPTPTAPKPADGGARVPGSEFSIPTVFIPFPKYDQGRAFDQFPGTPPAPPTLAVPPPPLRPTVPMPQAPSASARIPGSEFSIPALPTAPPPSVTSAPYTLGSLPTNLPMATLPSVQQPAITPRPATNPTPDRQQVPLAPPSTVQPQPGGGNTYSFSMPVTINGQTLQQMKDQAHQTLEDAFNNFFAGASAAGPPAPGSVAGAGR